MRGLNPFMRIITEVADYRCVRFGIDGNRHTNAWAERLEPEAQKSLWHGGDDDTCGPKGMGQWANLCKQWVHRSNHVNKASCYASGEFLSEVLSTALI